MIKKALSFLVVLAMTAPIVVLACNCCPKTSHSVSGPGIYSEDCGGCVPAEVNRQKSNLNQELKPLSILSSSRHCETREAGRSNLRTGIASSAFGLLAMTVGFAPPPLYLSLQVLRL